MIFKKGYYLYIRSAQNNLTKRVSRHLKKSKRKHWHIDYLISNKNTNVTKIYYSNLSKKYECIIAEKLLQLSRDYMKNLGSSDCGCISHLIKYNKNMLKELEEYKLEEIKLNS